MNNQVFRLADIRAAVMVVGKPARSHLCPGHQGQHTGLHVAIPMSCQHLHLLPGSVEWQALQRSNMQDDHGIAILVIETVSVYTQHHE